MRHGLRLERARVELAACADSSSTTKAVIFRPDFNHYCIDCLFRVLTRWSTRSRASQRIPVSSQPSSVAESPSYTFDTQPDSGAGLTTLRGPQYNIPQRERGQDAPCEDCEHVVASASSLRHLRVTKPQKTVKLYESRWPITEAAQLHCKR